MFYKMVDIFLIRGDGRGRAKLATARGRGVVPVTVKAYSHWRVQHERATRACNIFEHSHWRVQHTRATFLKFNNLLTFR